jgi:hypothetical protein
MFNTFLEKYGEWTQQQRISSLTTASRNNHSKYKCYNSTISKTNAKELLNQPIISIHLRHPSTCHANVSRQYHPTEQLFYQLSNHLTSNRTDYHRNYHRRDQQSKASSRPAWKHTCNYRKENQIICNFIEHLQKASLPRTITLSTARVKIQSLETRINDKQWKSIHLYSKKLQRHHCIQDQKENTCVLGFTPCNEAPQTYVRPATTTHWVIWMTGSHEAVTVNAVSATCLLIRLHITRRNKYRIIHARRTSPQNFSGKTTTTHAVQLMSFGRSLSCQCNSWLKCWQQVSYIITSRSV